MKVVCIIQARSGSTRFKEKILSQIKKKTLLEILIERLKKSKKIDQIVIATTKKKDDIKIIKIAKKKNVSFFRGSEKNVLKRYIDCAVKFKATIIVRITSDCPLSDPTLIDTLIYNHLKKKVQYSSNINPRSFPDGLDIEIINFKSLLNLKSKKLSLYDKEHVTPYLIKSKNIKKYNYKYKRDYSKLRWTIDYKKDYLYLKKIFKKIKYNHLLPWEKILKKVNDLK